MHDRRMYFQFRHPVDALEAQFEFGNGVVLGPGGPGAAGTVVFSGLSRLAALWLQGVPRAIPGGVAAVMPRGGVDGPPTRASRSLLPTPSPTCQADSKVSTSGAATGPDEIGAILDIPILVSSTVEEALRIAYLNPESAVAAVVPLTALTPMPVWAALRELPAPFGLLCRSRRGAPHHRARGSR